MARVSANSQLATILVCRKEWRRYVGREFGLEATQVVLGHAKADVTQVYAERDLAKGVEVARKIG
jgi:hypothetical protein